MIKYVCEEHIDDIMDDLINEYESFPIMEECEDKQCEYCNNRSKYLVKIADA